MMASTVLEEEDKPSEIQSKIKPENKVTELNLKNCIEFDDVSRTVTAIPQEECGDNINKTSLREITSCEEIQEKLNDGCGESPEEEKNSEPVHKSLDIIKESEHFSKPVLEKTIISEQSSILSVQECNKSESSNLINQPLIRKQFVFIKKIIPATPRQVISEDPLKESEIPAPDDLEECSNGNKRKREQNINNGLVAPCDSTNSSNILEPLIKRRRNLKSDGTLQEIDRYCWICHKDGIVICCATCPRVYHLRCVQLEETPSEDWVCPECITILNAENIETRSRAMRQLSLDQLCNLLKYALHRMKAYPGTEPFCKPVDQTLFPRYSEFVAHPMDMSQLERNIRRRMYGSTEAFIADTKWILHDCIIFNTHHTKLSSTAKAILKICKQEMSEIEICPDCYLNAHTRKDSWFIEVCRKPHILLWAKLKGFPFWPAKVMRTNRENMVDVRFFGAHDRAWVPVRDCFLYSKSIPTIARNKKKHNLEACVSEVEQHIRKLKERFGRFEYAPFRTLFDPTKEEEQLALFLPGYQGESAVGHLPFQQRFRPRILRKLSEKPLPVDPQTRLGAFRVSAVNSESSGQAQKSEIIVNPEMSAKEEEPAKEPEQRPVSASTSPLAPGPGRQLRVYSRRRRSPVSSPVPTTSPTPDADPVVKLEPEDVEPSKIGSASLSDWARFEMEAARITMSQHQSNASDMDCDYFVGDEPVTSETCDISVVDIVDIKEEPIPEISPPPSPVDTEHLTCENSIQEVERLLVPVNKCDETTSVEEAGTVNQFPDSPQTFSLAHEKHTLTAQENENEILNISEKTDRPPVSGESDMESVNITEDDTSSLSSASESAETEIWAGMAKVDDEKEEIHSKEKLGSCDSVKEMTFSLEENPKILDEKNSSSVISRKRSHDSDESPISPKLANIESKQTVDGKESDSMATHSLEIKHQSDDANSPNIEKGGLLPALIRRLHGTQPHVFLSRMSSEDNAEKISVVQADDVDGKENDSSNVGNLEVDGSNYASICSPTGGDSNSRSSLSSSSSSESHGSNSTNGTSGSSNSSSSSSSNSSSNQSSSTSDASSQDVSDSAQFDEKKLEHKESPKSNDLKKSSSESENESVNLDVTKASEAIAGTMKKEDGTFVPDTFPHEVTKDKLEITDTMNTKETCELPVMEKSNILDTEEMDVDKYEGFDVKENEEKQSCSIHEGEIVHEGKETKEEQNQKKEEKEVENERLNCKELKDDVEQNIASNSKMEEKEILAECRRSVIRDYKKGATNKNTNKPYDKIPGERGEENEVIDKEVDAEQEMKKIDQKHNAAQKPKETIEKQNAVQENVEKQNAVQETVENQNVVQETVEKQNAVQEIVEKQNPVQETVEKRNAVQDTVEKQNDVLETAEKQKDLQETAQKENDVQETAQKENDVQETAQKQNDVQETAQKQNDVQETAQKQNDVQKTVEKQKDLQESDETIEEQCGARGREETAENQCSEQRNEKSGASTKCNLEESFLEKQKECKNVNSKIESNLEVNKAIVQKVEIFENKEKECHCKNIEGEKTNIEETESKFCLETERNEKMLHSTVDNEMEVDEEHIAFEDSEMQMEKEICDKGDHEKVENVKEKAVVQIKEKNDNTIVKSTAKKKGQKKREEKKKENNQIVSRSSKSDVEEKCTTKSKIVPEKLLVLPDEVVPSKELSLITCIKQEPLDVDEDLSTHEEEADASLMTSLREGGVERRSLLGSTADERDNSSPNTLSDKDGGVLPSYLYPSVTITVDNDKCVETNGPSNSLLDVTVSQESNSQGDGTINIEEVKASVGLPRAISLSVIAANTTNVAGGKDSNTSSTTSGCESTSYDNSENCGAPTILTTPMGYTVTAHNGLEISTHPAPSATSMQPEATTSAPPSQGRARKSFPNRPHPQVKITRSLSSGPGGKNLTSNSRRRSTDTRQGGPFISHNNSLSTSQNDDVNSGASSVRNSDGPMVYIPPTSARFSGLPNGPSSLINADLSTPPNGMGASHSGTVHHQAITLAGDHILPHMRQKSLPQHASKCNGIIPPEAGPVSENISKHSLKLAGYMQQTIEDVLRDMSNTGNLEASTKMLQLELEKVHWRYQQEIAELKHNTDLLLVEMRASMMSEQQRAVADAMRQCEVDKQRAIEETKKKQWCTSCGKEALFYCCWNTSYCDYPCQQRHWPQHMASCGQAESMKARESAENGLPSSGGPAASLIHHAPAAKSYAPSPQPWPDPLPNSNPWSSPSPRGMGSGEVEGEAATGSRSPSPSGEGGERSQVGREWGSLIEAPGTGAAAAAARKSALKRKRCGRCAGCSRSNCGRCPPCLNARTHQVCRERRCSDLQPVEVVPVSSLKKTQLAIPSGGTPTSKGIPLSGMQPHRSRGSAPPYGLMPMPRPPMQVVGRVQPASSTAAGIAASSNITTTTSTSATTSCVAFVHTPVNSESSPVILCHVSGRGATSGAGASAAATSSAAAGVPRSSVPSAGSFTGAGGVVVSPGCPPTRPLRSSPATAATLLHLRPVVAAAPMVRLP